LLVKYAKFTARNTTAKNTAANHQSSDAALAKEMMSRASTSPTRMILTISAVVLGERGDGVSSTSSRSSTAVFDDDMSGVPLPAQPMLAFALLMASAAFCMVGGGEAPEATLNSARPASPNTFAIWGMFGIGTPSAP